MILVSTIKLRKLKSNALEDSCHATTTIENAAIPVDPLLREINIYATHPDKPSATMTDFDTKRVELQTMVHDKLEPVSVGIDVSKTFKPMPPPRMNSAAAAKLKPINESARYENRSR